MHLSSSFRGDPVAAKRRTQTTIYNVSHLESFERDILIVCKYCGEQAMVREIITLQTTPSRRVAKACCSSCGKTWNLSYERETLPLWLVADYRGHRLWAFNERHLSWLEEFIRAELREDKRAHGSSALHAVLPRWMTSSKNRSGVTKALRRLRLRLVSTKS